MSQHLQACSAGAVAAAAEKPAYEQADIVRHIAHELRQPLSTIESIAFYLEMVLPRTEGKARRQLGKLQQEVTRILALPELKDLLAAGGMTVVASTPAQFTEFLASESAKFARIIQIAGVKPE